MERPQHGNWFFNTLKWRGTWASTGWLLILLGGSGLLGRLLLIPALVQPFASRAPVRPFAAIGLLALGIGTLALDRRRRRVALITAVIGILIGYIAILSLVTGLDLELDKFLLRPELNLRIPPTSPKVLPLATAIGFLLGGGSLAIIAARFREATAGAFAVGLAGATLAALNLTLLLGQVLGLSQSLQFGRLAGASPQVALGLFALGVSLASWAWSRDWTPTTYPAWIPVAVGLASLSAVLLIWRGLVQGQRDDYNALLGAVARGTEDRIEEAMGRTNTALWRAAWLSPRDAVGSDRWAAQMQSALVAVPGLSRIAWVGTGLPAVILPPAADSAVLQLQLAMQLPPNITPNIAALDSVRHFSLADASPTVAIAIPRCDLKRCDGFIVGLLRVDEMLRPLVGDSLDGFHRWVSWRGQPLFGLPSRPEEEHELYRSVLAINDMTWDIAVRPTSAVRARMLSGLPDLVLAFGLLVSALLPVTLQLGRTLKANARSAEQVRLRLALGRSMDRAWSWDLQGNAAAAPALFASGSGQELRQGGWTELIHPEDRRRVEALLTAHLQGRAPTFEAQYRLRDGPQGWRWRVDRGHVTERARDGTPLQMLGVSGDVSERRRVDEEREKTERRFRAIFDSAYHLQGLLDLDGRVLEANPTALRLLGPEAQIEAVQGAEFWEARWWPTPQVKERIRRAAQRAREGQTVTDEVEIQGSGGDRATLDLSFKPIRDADGTVTQLLVEGRDITASRRAEALLREIQSLSSMGRLAARVAHEINNPLAGIQNSFLLLRDAIPSDHPHYSYVAAMEREIGRIASVTRQLYETYRPDSNGTGATGVRTLIGDAAAFLEQVNRPSKVRIRTELDTVPSQVAIPESVLRQSVYNLVQNAVEASPPGGTVTVYATLEDSTFVLRVRDEGPGVPLENRNRIFQPMAAMGETGGSGGTGIGLFLVDRSVRALGGSVEIADPPDGGTEFVVKIPLGSPPLPMERREN
jgi:PAS domain S-box-containing protein